MVAVINHLIERWPVREILLLGLDDKSCAQVTVMSSNTVLSDHINFLVILISIDMTEFMCKHN